MGVIPIRGNWLGMGMFVLSALVGVVLGLGLRWRDPATMIGVGVSLIVMDLAVRVALRKGPRWLVARDSGGYFFFVPVWVLGCIVAAINLVSRR